MAGHWRYYRSISFVICVYPYFSIAVFVLSGLINVWYNNNQDFSQNVGTIVCKGDTVPITFQFNGCVHYMGSIGTTTM